MSKLIIPDYIKNGTQGTKVSIEKQSEVYLEAVREANERIRQNKIKEALTWIEAQNFIAL